MVASHCLCAQQVVCVYVHTYVHAKHVCTYIVMTHSHQHFNALQSEIGFRVTDAKKGVSVFWDLPKLEERLYQMRELYQVRMATYAHQQPPTHTNNHLHTPTTTYAHQQPPTTKHHTPHAYTTQLPCCAPTFAHPACVPTVHVVTRVDYRIRTHMYIRTCVIVMHSGAFGWGFPHCRLP